MGRPIQWGTSADWLLTLPYLGLLPGPALCLHQVYP